MAWYQRYRLLLVVYGLGLFVGVREFRVSREGDPLTWLSPEGAELTEVLARLNPRDPDTEFLRSMQVLAGGDDAEFSRLLETALESDIKHNELLLKFHVDYLLSQGADWEQVNRALVRWRRNYPFSPMSISLPLTRPPRSMDEADRLQRALAGVPWIADSWIQAPPEGSGRAWQVELTFNRGRSIDIRDAITAISAASGG